MVRNRGGYLKQAPVPRQLKSYASSVHNGRLPTENHTKPATQSRYRIVAPKLPTMSNKDTRVYLQQLLGDPWSVSLDDSGEQGHLSISKDSVTAFHVLLLQDGDIEDAKHIAAQEVLYKSTAMDAVLNFAIYHSTEGKVYFCAIDPHDMEMNDLANCSVQDMSNRLKMYVDANFAVLRPQ
ncbi:hypothetical protein BDV96DRAFT_592384 [Lophiotrema nucula]|uniref:Uncharacterized protein n=1 Tax=Lophiotrema nucula TaxID=690887 RepID=A0A6A5YFI9_9PLEO|nr:hypothetical protein BDV96DRAFT_592384 [Lophiotrema nucula]